ncbi:MAG: alpha/beta hydrolase [Acidobacteriia bacterium]|nr:alpha/beta hydrolase [Terriglobia bacterium]
MQNILIAGPDELLSTHLAAACLLSSQDHIFYISGRSSAAQEQEIAHSVLCAARHLNNAVSIDSGLTSLQSRLHVIHQNSEEKELALPDAIHQAWYFSAAHHPKVQRRRPPILQSFAGLLEAARQTRFHELNYVGSLYDESWRKAGEDLRKEKVRNRIFLTSLIVDESRPFADAGCHDALHFLAVLHQLKAEIQERSPEYFDFQSLRCLGPAEAGLNLIRANDAIDLMLRIAASDSTLDHLYEIAGPEDTPFGAFCERGGEAYGLGLLAVDDGEPLNVIDRLFEARLCGFREYLTPAHPLKWRDSYLAAGADPSGAKFGEEEQIHVFEMIRENQDAQREARLQRAAALPQRLQKKTIVRNGSELTYFVGGAEGSTIVFLNALGQEMKYWVRLMELLMHEHQVIYWDPRGTTAPPPPFGLDEQVADLDAVLQNEQVHACHLVAWCTGPKVAMKFSLHRPEAVLSMVLLNMTFKCFGSPEDLETTYEHNFEPLCQILRERPAMAASVMKSLQSSMVENDPQDVAELDSDAMALNVLSSMNLDLRTDVLAPFRNEATMLNYAQQILDFWSHDMRTIAARINVPVLLIGSEYDKIASPNTSHSAISFFSKARSLQIQGASHYCLYDHPDLIAGLIEDFFRDPNDRRTVYGEVREVQLTEAATI